MFTFQRKLVLSGLILRSIFSSYVVLQGFPFNPVLCMPAAIPLQHVSLYYDSVLPWLTDFVCVLLDWLTGCLKVAAVVHEAAMSSLSEGIHSGNISTCVYSQHFDVALTAVKPRITDVQLKFYREYASERSNHLWWFAPSSHLNTHPFNGPFSGTTQVSRYQKGKTNLDFTEARDSEWQWHQLGHMQVCTSLQTDNHTSTPPLCFYRPGALPAAQPTASKH